MSNFEKSSKNDHIFFEFFSKSENRKDLKPIFLCDNYYIAESILPKFREIIFSLSIALVWVVKVKWAKIWCQEWGVKRRYSNFHISVNTWALLLKFYSKQVLMPVCLLQCFSFIAQVFRDLRFFSKKIENPWAPKKFRWKLKVLISHWMRELAPWYFAGRKYPRLLASCKISAPELKYSQTYDFFKCEKKSFFELIFHDFWTFENAISFLIEIHAHGNYCQLAATTYI